MSNNQSIRNTSANASINDYEYISNFKLGSFEDKSYSVRVFEGVEYCMRYSYKDNKLNEERFNNCYSLRKQYLDKADKLDMFNF